MSTLVLSEIRRNLIEILVRRLRTETEHWAARTASIELDEDETTMVRNEMRGRGVSILVELSHAIEAELKMQEGDLISVSCEPEDERVVLHYALCGE